MRVGDKCTSCAQGAVEHIRGTAPYDPDHLQCPVCDSTYCLTPIGVYSMKADIKKLQDDLCRMKAARNILEAQKRELEAANKRLKQALIAAGVSEGIAELIEENG